MVGQSQPVVVLVVLTLASACTGCPVGANGAADASGAVPTATPSATASHAAADPSSAAASRESAITDPLTYCAAVGTVDNVDGRYTGPKEPPAIRNQLHTDGAFTWRCDGGKVLACSFGANLPCGKANANRIPTAAEAQFCGENPSSPVIPAYITGHDTLFAWICQK
ncbi:MAG: hypothetical protein ACREJ3_20280, partial [Polyangiaceae bacterium]